jgi:hypothetical protein
MLQTAGSEDRHQSKHYTGPESLEWPRRVVYYQKLQQRMPANDGDNFKISQTLGVLLKEFDGSIFNTL